MVKIFAKIHAFAGGVKLPADFLTPGLYSRLSLF
jgi:hypothetical protein